MARISKGRTFREVVVANVVWGSLRCWLFFALFGNTALHAEHLEQRRVLCSGVLEVGVAGDGVLASQLVGFGEQSLGLGEAPALAADHRQRMQGIAAIRVVFGEGPVLDLERPAQHQLGVDETSHLPPYLAQVAHARGHGRVLLAECFRLQLQRLAVVGLSVGKAALGPAQGADVVDDARHFEMLRSEDVLLDLQRPQVEVFGVLEAFLPGAQAGELEQVDGDVAVLGAEGLLADLDRLLEGRP